jgi:hypothetical protein
MNFVPLSERSNKFTGCQYVHGVAHRKHLGQTFKRRYNIRSYAILREVELHDKELKVLYLTTQISVFVLRVKCQKRNELLPSTTTSLFTDEIPTQD